MAEATTVHASEPGIHVLLGPGQAEVLLAQLEHFVSDEGRARREELTRWARKMLPEVERFAERAYLERRAIHRIGELTTRAAEAVEDDRSNCELFNAIADLIAPLMYALDGTCALTTPGFIERGLGPVDVRGTKV
jgi:hypothetical protein